MNFLISKRKSEKENLEIENSKKNYEKFEFKNV